MSAIPLRQKDGDVDAPMSLGGLFPDSDDSAEEEFEQHYTEQTILLCQQPLTIRQYAWHMGNANKVWPGTFSLAEFITAHATRYSTGGGILELGTATGALSIYLKQLFPLVQFCTSDMVDGGDVENNVIYNFNRNGVAGVPHISHTWGDTWLRDSELATTAHDLRFKYIIASDILIYVSAYPELVKTLKSLFLAGLGSKCHKHTRGFISTEKLGHCIEELFRDQHELIGGADDDIPLPIRESEGCGGFDGVEFVMSWQRRIADSKVFFQLMEDEGFFVHHHGKHIYSFFLLYDPKKSVL